MGEAARSRPAAGRLTLARDHTNGTLCPHLEMLHRQTRDLVFYFARAQPGRTACVVLLLVLAAGAEGIGLLSLLPLLELASAGAGTARSTDGGPALAVLDRLGLPTTAGVLLGLIVAGIWLKGLFLWLAMRHVGNTVADVATELRMRLLRALLHARWSFFTVLSPGDLSSAIGMEAHRAASAYRQAAAALARLVGVVLYAGLAFLVSWKIALLALFVGLVCIVGLAGLVRLAREGGQAQTATMRSLLAHITDALNTMKALRAMGCEEEAGRILGSDVEGLRRAQRRQVLAYESLRALQEPVTAAFLAAGLYAALALGGHPLNTILLLMLLFHRTLGGIHQMQAEYQAMVAGESAFQSLVHLTRRAEGVPEERRGVLPPPPLLAGIRLEKVSFTYGGRDVLKGVTCFLPAGELIALTGPSGAGKTTLLDLVLGLHAPSSGHVRVDDVCLELLDLPGWRRQVGYLPQDAILLHGTVYQNVALGRPHVDRGDVDEALRAAGAWEFVAERAEGLDYDVGAAGGRLSGGQRQRIALARALAGRPRLLVLDEFTAGLDSATERDILQRLRALRGRTTILAISHAPRVCDAADRVFHLCNGRLTEREALRPTVPLRREPGAA